MMGTFPKGVYIAFALAIVIFMSIAIQSTAKTVKELIKDAEQKHRSGDIDNAEKIYFKAIEQSGEGWVWVKLATFYDSFGQHEKALKVTELKIRRDFPEEISNIAHIHNRAIQALGPKNTTAQPLVLTTVENRSGKSTYSKASSVPTSLYSRIVEHKPQQEPQPKNNRSSSIHTNCVAKWKNDFSMIEYCIKKQTKARSHVAAKPNNVIKRDCRQKWGTDYSMVEYCINKQTAARNRISRR